MAENRSDLLIAGEEGRHLEQLKKKENESTPDYIDIDTGERIDICTPQGNVNTMRNEVRGKMKADQADIIVVNAYYSPASLDEILGRIDAMARDRPVTVIDKEGEFYRLDPNVVSHHQSESAVTFARNGRSRSIGIRGHVAPEYAPDRPRAETRTR